MQMKQKQTSQMRLFVLNTDYVWRYKYKKDKHLEPNDRFEFEMCILSKNFELIILTHFGTVLLAIFDEN